MSLINPQYISTAERGKRAFFFFLHRVLRGVANRVLDKSIAHPREFSNEMIRAYAPLFSGSVLNVSGWNDGDRAEGSYREYFTGKTSYAVSNHETRQRGVGSMDGTGIAEITLNLNKPIPKELEQSYDIVFNHTTLEHVIHVEQAFANLCALSRDAVMLVVPTIQQFHIVESYGDYFRLMPFAVAKLFKLHGFTPLVLASNEQPFAPIYTFAIGVRDPKKYEGVTPTSLNLDVGHTLYGSSAKPRFFDALLDATEPS